MSENVFPKQISSEKRQCMIESCKNFGNTSNSVVQFFKPRQGIVRKWMDVISQYQDVESISFICELHFELDCFFHRDGKVTLKPGAIPSIFCSSKQSNGTSLKEKRKMKSKNRNTEKGQKVSAACDGCNERDRQIQMLLNRVAELEKRLERHKSSAQNGNSSTSNNHINIQNPASSDVEMDSDGHEYADFDMHEPELQIFTIETVKIKCEQNADDEHIMPEIVDVKPILSENGQIQNPVSKPLNFPTGALDVKSNFECYICKEIFKSILQVKTHLKRHDDNSKCKICLEKFKQGEIDKHLCLEEDQQVGCEYCDQAFVSTKDLLDHLKNHNGEIKFHRCSECPRYFEMDILLKYHQRYHEKNAKSLICQVCSRTYDSIEKIRNHMRTHKKVKTSNLCVKCGKSFSSIYALKLHEKSHEERTIKCPECPQLFFNKYALKEHRFLHSGAKFACTICDYESLSPKSLARHMRSHHSSKPIEPVECEICSNKYKNRKQLLKHMNAKHSDKPPRMKTSNLCVQCGKSFTSSYSLKLHEKTHEIPTIKCPECPQLFRKNYDLKVHSYSHNGIKFPCTICGFECASPKSLVRHMRSHESPKPDEPVECEICLKKYKNKSQLRKHMKLHSNNRTRFQCDYCPLSYQQRYDLNKHLKTHLGEEIHKCQQCDKRFKFALDLRKHYFEHCKVEQEDTSTNI